MKSLGSSYNQDAWELTVIVDGKEYTYVNVSPYHNDQFVSRAKRNWGRAMSYVKDFKEKKDCSEQAV